MSKTIFIDNQEYISINEFAKEVGYSPQGIYKKINNPLNPLNELVKTVKGVKYLPKSSISVFSVETVIENSGNSLNENLNPLNNNFNSLNEEETAPREEKKDSSAPDITIEIIEMLRAELETKNKQIEDLTTQLAETTKALHQAQELTHREQDLNAKNVLLLESQEQKKKRGIFKRIFKGKDNE